MIHPRCILTVDVEAFHRRASNRHVDTLIYGHINGKEWGIGRMMDIADRHNIKMTFFLDFAEVEFYGNEIIEVGKYIVSRKHDLQIHCHYELLREKIFAKFPNAEPSYYTWYENEEISDFILEYCIEQYCKCTCESPILFRGGAYRFGVPLLKKLREKGFVADATYNAFRPKPLPANKQFFYENGLLELPIGTIPETESAPAKLMSFNTDGLYPTKAEDWIDNLKAYERLFRNYYGYYGNDAIASLIMHSWSFCWEEKRVQTMGFFDQPNPYAADVFDRFLDNFCNRIDFITAAQAALSESMCDLRTESFKTVFSRRNLHSRETLQKVVSIILERANGRDIVIWGRGWLETEIMETLDVVRLLNVKFYISRDAAYKRTWRNKPVFTFEEAKITPKQHYIFVCAQLIFPEIREALKRTGFEEYCDFYDFEKLESGARE